MSVLERALSVISVPARAREIEHVDCVAKPLGGLSRSAGHRGADVRFDAGHAESGDKLLEVHSCLRTGPNVIRAGLSVKFSSAAVRCRSIRS